MRSNESLDLNDIRNHLRHTNENKEPYADVLDRLFPPLFEDISSIPQVVGEDNLVNYLKFFREGYEKAKHEQPSRNTLTISFLIGTFNSYLDSASQSLSLETPDNFIFYVDIYHAFSSVLSPIAHVSNTLLGREQVYIDEAVDQVFHEFDMDYDPVVDANITVKTNMLFSQSLELLKEDRSGFLLIDEVAKYYERVPSRLTWLFTDRDDIVPEYGVAGANLGVTGYKTIYPYTQEAASTSR